MTTASEKRVLVVDDEPDVRNFLVACLEDAGFNVDTAVDGVDALEKVAENPPDLMTLDMVMPRKSGISVIRTLRQNEKYSKMPIIVITAHAHDELGSEDIKGFNAFASGLKPRYTFEKPISPGKLVKAISDILDVEIESGGEDAGTSDKLAIKQLLDQTDADTLKKIRGMLNQGS
jgi:CheY-like chemotaxis protein